MKKFIAILAVLAITGFSVVAFAADVTVGGSYEIRSRDFNMLNLSKEVTAADSGDQTDTQTRIRLDVNAKAGDVKGKLQLESDFGTGSRDWGQNFDTYSVNNSGLGFREAWVLFPLPGIPVNVKAGHQLLQLGNGWFFRSQHFGSDAWVVFNDTGNNHLGFVNVKFNENQVYAADDADAYVIVDTFKLNENNKIGIDLTFANFRQPAGAGTENKIQNLGLNYNGKLGPLALKAEFDIQSGKFKSPGGDSKYKGNQIVIEGSMPMDALTINFWLARGTGDKAGSVDTDAYVTVMDIDPHYTFLHEYKIAGANGGVHQGFSNTMAAGLGAMFNVSKALAVGANFWYLQATEKTNIDLDGAGTAYNTTGIAASDKLGTEVDVMINWKLYDNLTWNWVLGWFDPGDAYKNNYTGPGGGVKGDQASTGIQGVLKFAF
jgi:hypothetical protein